MSRLCSVCRRRNGIRCQHAATAVSVSMGSKQSTDDFRQTISPAAGAFQTIAWLREPSVRTTARRAAGPDRRRRTSVSRGLWPHRGRSSGISLANRIAATRREQRYRATTETLPKRMDSVRPGGTLKGRTAAPCRLSSNQAENLLWLTHMPTRSSRCIFTGGHESLSAWC